MLTVIDLDSATVCDAGSICGDYPQCNIFSPMQCFQSQQPRPGVSEPVERTLCVILVVLFCGHPPSCHTLVALSSWLQAMAKFLSSQFPLILPSQESSSFTGGQCMLTHYNQIILKL